MEKDDPLPVARNHLIHNLRWVETHKKTWTRWSKGQPSGSEFKCTFYGARDTISAKRLYQDCASGDQSLQGDSVARLIISDSDSTIVMHKIASGISEAPVVPRRISHVSYGSSPKTLRRVKN
mmetsp:Transcript_13389/g.21894  ORF Transcript_13389/g.21894 Transcript_13389/m.21894 type:complete len:122 (-) Transcript_13389:130-495(-)